MQKSKVDRKAIDEINRIQAKYGGYKPDLILMLFTKRLDCLTKTLIGLTTILAILTAVNIWLLIRFCE